MHRKAFVFVPFSKPSTLALLINAHNLAPGRLFTDVHYCFKILDLMRSDFIQIRSVYYHSWSIGIAIWYRGLGFCYYWFTSLFCSHFSNRTSAKWSALSLTLRTFGLTFASSPTTVYRSPTCHQTHHLSYSLPPPPALPNLLPLRWRASVVSCRTPSSLPPPFWLTGCPGVERAKAGLRRKPMSLSAAPQSGQGPCVKHLVRIFWIEINKDVVWRSWLFHFSLSRRLWAVRFRNGLSPGPCALRSSRCLSPRLGVCLLRCNGKDFAIWLEYLVHRWLCFGWSNRSYECCLHLHNNFICNEVVTWNFNGDFVKWMWSQLRLCKHRWLFCLIKRDLNIITQ